MAGKTELQIIITAKDLASRELKKLNNTIQNNAATFRKVGLGMTAIGTGLGFLTKKFIDAAAGFEQSQVAFTTMLGSAEKADALLKDLAQFAAKTPFQLKDVEKGARSLLAFGINTKKILPTLKSLGDVSAGLSVPIERLILNYGQVKSQSKLTGRELMDFARAGIPLLGELADMLGKSEAEITSMVSAGKIGFPIVEKAFQKMSGEGGRFNDLMDKQSKTFAGMMSNMQDQIDLFLREGGKPLIEAGKKIAGVLITVIEKVNKWTKEHPELTKMIGILVAVLAGLLLVLGPLVLLLPTLAAGFTLLLGPIGLISLGIMGLIAVGALWVSKWDTMKAALGIIWDELKEKFQGDWFEDRLGGMIMSITDFIDKIGEATNKVTGFVTNAGGIAKNIPGAFMDLFKAGGGPVDKDGAYIVGENGPELFSPSRDGSIIPNSALNNSDDIFKKSIEKSFSSSGKVNNVFNFNFAGAFIGDKKQFEVDIINLINRQSELAFLAGE